MLKGKQSMPIQGSAADIIKLAMVKIHKNLFNYKNDVSMLMQVHDELVFEIKKIALINIQRLSRNYGTC